MLDRPHVTNVSGRLAGFVRGESEEKPRRYRCTVQDLDGDLETGEGGVPTAVGGSSTGHVRMREKRRGKAKQKGGMRPCRAEEGFGWDLPGVADPGWQEGSRGSEDQRQRRKKMKERRSCTARETRGDREERVTDGNDALQTHTMLSK